MANQRLTLITGRSIRQGTGISAGKERQEYRDATEVVQLNPSDMDSWGVREGDSVRLTSEFGSVQVACRSADVPEGLAFMPFGSACNRLVGGETYASGMPDSKHVEIELEKID